MLISKVLRSTLLEIEGVKHALRMMMNIEEPDQMAVTVERT